MKVFVFTFTFWITNWRPYRRYDCGGMLLMLNITVSPLAHSNSETLTLAGVAVSIFTTIGVSGSSRNSVRPTAKRKYPGVSSAWYACDLPKRKGSNRPVTPPLVWAMYRNPGRRVHEPSSCGREFRHSLSAVLYSGLSIRPCEEADQMPPRKSVWT